MILADKDEELEFEALPGMEMRKAAAPLARKLQRLLCHAKDQKGQVGGS